ncbi:hypothetical protein [Coleofasciculus sp. F4-SAH-05]|uniref:hypothetical protein n=1 Tax=Coleofasciculus sp. F4-SAH-05 TaxID=3069525 RepID=UPI0032FB10D7
MSFVICHLSFVRRKGLRTNVPETMTSYIVDSRNLLEIGVFVDSIPASVQGVTG